MILCEVYEDVHEQLMNLIQLLSSFQTYGAVCKYLLERFSTHKQQIEVSNLHNHHKIDSHMSHVCKSAFKREMPHKSIDCVYK